MNLNDVSAIASTSGPGLIVCLTVGLNFGKALSASLNIPFIGVNHLEGHALSPMLNSSIKFPYLLLLISGGHTQFLSVENLKLLILTDFKSKFDVIVLKSISLDMATSISSILSKKD